MTLMTMPVLAQGNPEQASEETFFEQVAVSVVNVEVFVTDKEGNPITDLTRDDFEVTEDGRPVEIVNFYRVSGGTPQPEAQSEPEAPTAQEAARPGPLPVEVAIPESQRLHLVIFVDNFNIHPLNRNRVFSRLRVFLNDTLKRGDEVVLASYDRSLHLRHPFTEDVDAVNRALVELEGFSGSALERESERAEALKLIYETDSVYNAFARAKTFSENQHHEVNRALDALREMLDSLAGLPGRKMLIHLSDGLPMVPGQDLYQAIQQRFGDVSAIGEAFTRDLSRRYTELIAHANSSRISFYTIDASGLQTRSGMGAESATINTQVPVSMAVDGIRSSNLQGTLVMMAGRTGGQAIINTNDVSAGLERFAADIGNYYSLGYRAPTTERGRYHEIEVRLRAEQRGWELRHREGYRDKSERSEMQDGIKAFLVHGYQTNPLGVTVDVGEQSAGSDGLIAVPVRVRVPIERIVLLPRGEFYEGRLRLYFGAADEEGRDAPLQELPFELRIPKASLEMARRDEMARVIDATMRPGPHKLVVVVRDELGAERAIVGRNVDVGDVGDGEKKQLPKSLDFRRQ
jgi:VWFA-related protein